jgi:hypothetical protein
MSYGIKISKSGVDVTKTVTEKNKKDFIILDATEVHKLMYADFVTGGSYTHGLSKVPFFIPFSVDSTSNPTYFRAYLLSRATSTQITNLPDPCYLMVFWEGS